MTEIKLQLDLRFYKTPSDEIIRYRKEFYGLWRRCDDETATWLNRVQSLINHCEFPPVLSREYLLIDRFVCELNPNAREFIQSVSTWTLEQLKEYFFDQKIVPNNRVNVNISIDETIEHPNQQLPSALSSSAFALDCEFDDDSCSKNSMKCEVVEEEYPFIDVQTELQESLTEEDLSIKNSPIDIPNEVLFTAESDANSDLVNELLIDGMECEFENYEYLVSDDADVACDEFGDSSDINHSDRPLENEMQNSNKNTLSLSSTATKSVPNAKNQQQFMGMGVTPFFDIRPHVCKVCKMSFKHPSTLKTHLKMHQLTPSTGFQIQSINQPRPQSIVSHTLLPPEEEQSISVAPTAVTKETEPTRSVSIADMNSISTSQQQQQQNQQRGLPKKTNRRRKKIAITIGHDLQGNPITIYRKPINRIVHLPKHIQTPELLQTTYSVIPAKSNPSTQFIMTNKEINVLPPSISIANNDVPVKITTDSSSKQIMRTTSVRPKTICKPNTSVQAPNLLQTKNPTIIPAKSNSSKQLKISNNDASLKATTNTSAIQTIATSSKQPHIVSKQNTSKKYVYKVLPQTKY